VVGAVVLQAVIGYTQYFLHLPAGLVWVHVSCAVLLWILVLRLYLSTRERLPHAAAAGEAPAEAAAASPAMGTTPATHGVTLSES
jgi:cytochrome c oxidase assembly protein subunit 15